MKLLLLTAGCILSNLCFSQQLKPEIKELMKQTELNPPNSLIYSENNRAQKLHSTLYSNPDTVPNVRRVNGLPFKFGELPKSLVIQLNKGRIDPNKPGIYLLAQDNMPCIVPNTKNIAKVPNLWRGKVGPYRAKIPNPLNPVLPLYPKAIVPNGDTK